MSSPVPGDGPTERERLEAACLEGLVLTEHGYRYKPSVGADAVEQILAARTPAPSAAQALRDAADDYTTRYPISGESVEDVRRYLRARADRLDAAPTDPGTRRVEVVVYDQEPGPEVTEIEDRHTVIWGRSEHDGGWVTAEGGVGIPWDRLHDLYGPLVHVDTSARLRTPGTTEEGQGWSGEQPRTEQGYLEPCRCEHHSIHTHGGCECDAAHRAADENWRARRITTAEFTAECARIDALHVGHDDGPLVAP